MEEHGERLGVNVIAQRYGADPSAVARDAIEYATKHAIQVALVDTAGRMNISKPLMNELNKVVCAVEKACPQVLHIHTCGGPIIIPT